MNSAMLVVLAAVLSTGPVPNPTPTIVTYQASIYTWQYPNEVPKTRVHCLQYKEEVPGRPLCVKWIHQYQIPYRSIYIDMTYEQHAYAKEIIQDCFDRAVQEGLIARLIELVELSGGEPREHQVMWARGRISEFVNDFLKVRLKRFHAEVKDSSYWGDWEELKEEKQ